MKVNIPKANFTIYPEELTDMELLQLPTDVQREDKKSSVKLLTGEEIHNFIRSQQKGNIVKKNNI